MYILTSIIPYNIILNGEIWYLAGYRSNALVMFGYYNDLDQSANISPIDTQCVGSTHQPLDHQPVSSIMHRRECSREVSGAAIKTAAKCPRTRHLGGEKWRGIFSRGKPRRCGKAMGKPMEETPGK